MGARRYAALLIVAALGASVCATDTRASAADAKQERHLSKLWLHVGASPAEGASADVPALTLRGPDDRRQVLATAATEGGGLLELTRDVTYETTPPGVVTVSSTGHVSPQADGSATITARAAGGQSATLSVTVERFGSVDPVNFPNQVVPVFTKNGCNGGGCHGKLSGQNGFRLSLLGFEPREDYEHLVREARGRRLFPAAPENSLLLTKATAATPHGGGKRLEPASDDYRLVVRWIQQGMPYGKDTDPAVSRIEVFPKERTLSRGGGQQLVVLATYTDGSVHDVTRGALFEPNDKNLGEADETGLVRVFDQPGDVAVMVRYQSRVAVFRATVPLGAPVETLPPARNFIDELVFAKLKKVGMPPSEVCDDGTFLRRVTVDLAGRLPTPEEARAFLADTSPDKRDRCIDRLLDSADYADYFANKWSSVLRNKRDDAKDLRGSYAFHAWIRDALLTNKPYDRFVREILAASGDVEQNPPVVWYREVKEPNKELEDAAQLFLGMRLQCAQCHHHPYEKWSQQDYYGLAAFFSRVGRKPSGTPGEEVVFHRRGGASATNPKTKQSVKPTPLGLAALDLPVDDDPRLALVDWLTSKDNPFFARSLVNRYWKHLMARGLVEPEDDMRETNPPTNPELLDALAAHFVKSGFDLKDLLRTVCRSNVYQLSATPNAHNAVDRQYFSRYYPKRLNAEVLLDAVNGIAGAQSKFDNLPEGTRAVQLPDNAFNAANYFLQVFGRPESSSACECERSADASLAQTLHLINAKDIQEKLAADAGRASQLAADAARADDAKVEDLYLRAFARKPTADESAAARAYVEKTVAGKADKDVKAARKAAYEDLIWVLINTKEFSFNH
jgi:hypothetical protein